jgi:hypothetical protein
MSFRLQRSFLTDKKELIFETNYGFDQALSDGFFLIKKPTGLDLTPGDKFAENFYKDKQGNCKLLDLYKGFKVHTPDKFNFQHEGYYLRDIDQTEQFFLEKRFWDEIYPNDLAELARDLNHFAIDILKNILSYIEIPEHLWAMATGQCIKNNGTHHLTFNHFRPEKNARGLNVHKDSGWVTVLRSIEPGLEAYINNVWTEIHPEDGYFIVNFGCAMEILTAESDTPISAIIHRVKQTKKVYRKADRYSYALFTDNSLDENICKGLYSYDKKNGLTLKVNFRKFLDEILHATYDKDTVGLY